MRTLLLPGGPLLIGDHFVGDGAMSNTALYMTPEEQAAALTEGGFSRVELVLQIHGSLRVTPAMEAGVSTHVWSVKEIVALVK